MGAAIWCATEIKNFDDLKDKKLRVYTKTMVDFAQGIGAVLYEEVIYDDQGQIQTASLVDYPVPSACEIPPMKVVHLEMESPTTLSMMRSPSPTRRWGSGKTSSMIWSARIWGPAAMRPTSGTGVILWAARSR